MSFWRMVTSTGFPRYFPPVGGIPSILNIRPKVKPGQHRECEDDDATRDAHQEGEDACHTDHILYSITTDFVTIRLELEIFSSVGVMQFGNI